MMPNCKHTWVSKPRSISLQFANTLSFETSSRTNAEVESKLHKGSKRSRIKENIHFSNTKKEVSILTELNINLV